ncbi:MULTISPECIES: CGNR zinc finger domain-containing protein [Streptomyces]|uniref:CGNR zinc finger domain-containing protein n=1 Tax=Streptomyces sudanensis TaxID=436397 RepID=A0ABY4TB32_9ACTN|nr:MULTISPECIES: CGNR zinc finger domain-containing protein [Streptomyces]MCP9958935.1 CGNR zinc finger domain-containing protein [Streptomyces sudanensis]MCP9988003.1 CGNR zinc finger domain-containing protein [Streptomyces sudanensis]URN16173.1 CGNR zinc finger domain-containing protein [Streptomyces sudanensis]
MPPPIGTDPRPLTGEPLAIDLLNTRWIDGQGRHDLLDGVDGLAVWLGSPPVRRALEAAGPVRADRDTLDRLLQARSALDEVVADVLRPTPEAAASLNAVLAHGRVRHLLRPEGPDTVVEADDPSWLPAWSAAADYLRLLTDRPDRIRHCANAQCVLHFYDVSKNGTRRWCSMAGCGNRAKARRHQARHQGG